jgi:hypothetical protein
LKSGLESKNVGKFLSNTYLIQNLGRDSSQNETEEFVCRLYRVPNIEAGVNKCRTTSPSIPSSCKIWYLNCGCTKKCLVNAIKLVSVALLWCSCDALGCKQPYS